MPFCYDVHNLFKNICLRAEPQFNRLTAFSGVFLLLFNCRLNVSSLMSLVIIISRDITIDHK